MASRMLPHVQRLQMQAEGAQLQQQRIDQLRRDPLAAVLRKARAQQQQVVAELRSRRRMASALRRFHVSVQALLHAHRKRRYCSSAYRSVVSAAGTRGLGE